MTDAYSPRQPPIREDRRAHPTHMPETRHPGPDSQRRSSPALFLILLAVIVLGIAAFIVLRGNGGHPGTQPATHSLPQGSPSK